MNAEPSSAVIENSLPYDTFLARARHELEMKTGSQERMFKIDQLIDRATAYNRGGDPNCRQKIEDALKMFSSGLE